MTQLLVEELKTTLSQDFQLTTDRRMTLSGIRLNLYMHNSPTGTFTVTLKTSANTLATQTFTSADLKTALSTSDNFLHIWKSFEFTNPIQLSKGTHTIQLSSSGYTFAESGYLGWIKPHEDLFNDLTSTITDDLNNPLGYRLYELRQSEAS